MAFSSVPSRLGPYVVKNVLCTISAGALLRIEDPQGGRRQTVMLLDPDVRWPARLRDREGLPPHPRLCALAGGAPEKVESGDRTFYYVGAETLSGWTVLDEIAREGAIKPLSRAVRFCAEAAEALSCAHAAGMPHGHLEPGCLFIQTFAEEHEGHIKLLGAGLKVTAGPSSRAARYRSPQLRSPRSRRDLMLADQVALGGVLFHMITGYSPDFSDPERTIWQGAEVVPALGEIILRALCPKPEERFPSVAAMRDALLKLDVGEKTWGMRPAVVPWRRRTLAQA